MRVGSWRRCCEIRIAVDILYARIVQKKACCSLP